MNSSKKSLFHPSNSSTSNRPTQKQLKENHIGSYTDSMIKNPLRQFLKRNSSFTIKTMETLNSNQTSINKNGIQKSKIKQERNSVISNDSKDTQKRQSYSSIKLDSQNQNFPYSKCSNDTVIERGISRQQLKKKTTCKFSSLKLSMDELITINQKDIKEQYTLEKLLGQGAYGQVYLAKSKITQEQRAIKIIKGNSMSQKKIQQFLSETQLLKGISHPSIIKVYDLCQYKGDYYVVMEYCKGGDLKTLSKIKYKPQSLIVNTIRQLLGALTYLHSLEIVHRDIKMDNIVFLNPVTQQNLRQFMPIKIIDFGTAVKMKYKFQHNNSIAGTITYMAPEIFKGILTQKSDVWSTGILMTRLLTGTSPFAASTERETIRNIELKRLNFSDKIFDRVSYNAKDIISKMLERNPHKRPSAKQLLKHPWFGECSNHFTHAQDIKYLQEYQEKDNLVQVVQCYLTIQKVNQDQREKMAKMFNQMDKDCSGHIQKTQFIQLFKLHSKTTTDDEIENIINLIDKDKSGKIDFNQFLVAMSNKQKLFIRQSLSQAFQYFDKDKTGFIQKEELKEMLKNCPNQQIQYFLSSLDIDEDNRISKEEFIEYIINS